MKLCLLFLVIFAGIINAQVPILHADRIDTNWYDVYSAFPTGSTNNKIYENEIAYDINTTNPLGINIYKPTVFSASWELNGTTYYCDSIDGTYGKHKIPYTITYEGGSDRINYLIFDNRISNAANSHSTQWDHCYAVASILWANGIKKWEIVMRSSYKEFASMTANDTNSAFNSAFTSNVTAVIVPWPGYSSFVEDFNYTQTKYPSVQFFFAHNENAFQEYSSDGLSYMPYVVTGGAGTIQNNDSYGEHFWFWDSNIKDTISSSYSISTIASKVNYVKTKLNCSWWEAIYRCAMTGSRNEPNRCDSPHDLYNGFGKIDTAVAITYSGSIPINPFTNQETLSITQPIRDETMYFGSLDTIKWSASSNISKVKIEYSVHSGTFLWHTITDSVDASVGEYVWTIPDSLSYHGKIKISDYNNNLIYSSSSEFSIVPYKTLTLTALIEAMYAASGTSMTMSPSVTVELRNASNYGLVESQTSILSTAGVGQFYFANEIDNTPYYIVFKYLNTIETWSATPQCFTNGILNYDFTTGLDKAYTDGSNPPLALQNNSSKYCIYSGDCNQDGFVTSDDFTGLDNDYNNNSYHLVNDLNGDGFITMDDYTFIENNNKKGIQRQVPPGYLGKLVIKNASQNCTVPKEFVLCQNYPNPFNPTTKIDFEVPEEAKVVMAVYSITGQKVIELVNQEKSAGYYTVNFNASKLSSGVYICRMTANGKATGKNFSSIKKMMLLK
ncbi:MAG: T9SS type A sorting domain-containing protein [Ignavibacteriaceae bacterium]|nr:T9SS type A sorting domain-containing protein [Ignavibacteriaceae bacterium]